MLCRNALAVMVAVMIGVPLLAQGDQSSDVEAMKAKLDRVIQSQARLEAENRDLRTLVDDLTASQANYDLEESVNALVGRLGDATTVNSAANPVTLTGEFRFRTVWATAEPDSSYNMTEGSPSTDEYDGYWTDARIDLGFEYAFADEAVAFVELQSHWAHGCGVATDGYNSMYGFGETSTPVRLYQGFIKLNNIFNQAELSTTIGRQEIVLGNQFQFGNADWYNGWSFDGARLDYAPEGWSLTALALKLTSDDHDLNQVHSALSAHDDDEIYGLYFSIDVAEDHTLDLYWIYMNGHMGRTVGSLGALGGSIPGTTAYFHTIGARLGGVCDVAAGLDYNIEVAYQFGDANNTSYDDVNGLAIEAEVGLTFEGENAFRVFLRFLFSEGAEDNETGYIPLFPNRHSNTQAFMARYGLLDAIPMSNVLSIQGGVTFKPAEQWLVGATFIWAIADEEGSADDDDYGWEGDIFAAYMVNKNLTLTFAGFIVDPDELLQYILGVNDDTIFGLVFQARVTF